MSEDDVSILRTTRGYIERLVDDIGGEEIALGKALDIIERALKNGSFSEGAMLAAKEALKVVIEALDKESSKLG